MTGLPKELITYIKRSSSHYSDEHPVKKTHSGRFKECMHKKQKEKHTSKKDLAEDKESPLNACASPLPSLKTQMDSCIQPAAMVDSASACTEIEALFEKMASTMLVMNSESEQQTTLFLDTPQYSSSAFFGTRITIKEFSTAPKIFNIEIASSPTALNLLTTHKDALLAAFDSHKLPFSVHRLDTELHGVEEQPCRHGDNDDGQDRKQDEFS